MSSRLRLTDQKRDRGESMHAYVHPQRDAEEQVSRRRGRLAFAERVQEVGVGREHELGLDGDEGPLGV